MTICICALVYVYIVIYTCTYSRSHICTCHRDAYLSERKKCRNHPVLFRHFAETAEILPKTAEILVSRPQPYCFHPLFDAICDKN